MVETGKFQDFQRGLVLVVLLVFALLFRPAQAAIVVDNVSTAIDNNPSSLTVSHTTGAGADRLMIVGVSFNNEDFETVTSVTYNGTGLNFIGQVSRNDDSRVELWSYLNPPAVTANVVVTFNEVVQRGGVLGVITFTGVDQGAPFAPFQSNNGNSSAATLNAISAPGETLFAVMAAERQDSPSVVVGGASQWSLKAQPGNNRTAGAGATYVGAPLINVRWNMNEPDDWVVGAISLRDASAVASPGFCDDFESGLGNWSLDTSGGGSAGINTDTAQSPNNSLFTRWGVVSVTTTNAISAAGASYFLSAWIRRGADSFSEDPDGGENLEVQYFNNLNNWVTLETFTGAGTPGEVFSRNYALPTDAQHNNLRIRFRQTAGSGVDWDYWHVDDVCILEVVQPQMEFRMDELSWDGSANEVQDSSGNGNHANANAASGLTTVNPGHICRAGDFDGVDDYIESSDIFATLRDTASMSFWINTTQTGNNIGWQAPGIAGVEQAGGADDIFWGWLDATGRIGISVGNDYTTKSTVAINDGTYHHVVLTRDAASGDWKIYIDGVLDASGTSTAGVIGTSFSSIGRIEDTGGTPEYFQGDLDEVLVFNSVLSDTAVTSIYTNQVNGLNLDGSQRVCQGSLAYFNLDEASGTWNGTPGEIADQSGNFNGAFALGTGAGVDAVPARVCNGIDIPDNNSNAAQYGFDTTVDIDDDVGNLGTISFWYNADDPWVGGGSRMLFDASPNDFPGPDKYFFLELQNDGRLQFALEDSNDGDFSLTTGVNSFPAATWVHIAATWNMGGSRQIYINGALAASNSPGTNGQIGALRTLYMGDNRSTYHPGASGGSADGIIDEVRIYARVQTGGEIITDMNATHSCSTSLTDHFEIAHDGQGINCRPEDVSISAHTALHAVDTAYTGTITLSTSTGTGTWNYVSGGIPANFNDPTSGDGSATYTFDGSENGSVVLGLSILTVETGVDIDVTDGTYTESTGTATAADDPSIDFVTAGFDFFADGVSGAIGTQISGKGSDVGYGSQLLEIEAIETDPAGNCVAAIDGVVNVDMAFQCENANVCQRSIYLGSAAPSTMVPGTNTDVVTPLAYTPVSLNFSNARATFVLNYPDAGEIQLHAFYTTPNGFDLIGGSNNFVVRPFGFDIDVPHPTTHATTAAGDILTRAGNGFRVDVSGALWNSADDDLGGSDGIPDNHNDLDPANNDDLSGNSVTLGGISYTGTPNFGQEGEDINLGSRLFAPAGGNDPALLNTTITTFVAGAGTRLDAIYNEVGIIEIGTDILDLDYLGIGVAETARMISKSGHVGRFTPDRFAFTTVTNGSFINSNVSGAVPYTYVGQRFSYDPADRPAFEITALAAGGSTTMNYSDDVGDWAKLSAASASFAAPTGDQTQNGEDGITPMAVSYSQDPSGFNLDDDNANGIIIYDFTNDDFTYTKDPNSKVPPFNPDIDIVITNVTDSDGIATTGTTTVTPDGSAPMEIRFGRLRMENVHGSELSELMMPYYIEFYDEIGATEFWTRHDDADTTTVVGDITATPGNTGATAITPIVPGTFEITLSAAGINVTERIEIEVDSSGEIWLQYDWDNGGVYDDNPFAFATFGIYDGNEFQIYQRQLFQ